MSRKKRNMLIMVIIVGIAVLVVVGFDLMRLSGSTAPNESIKSIENEEVDQVDKKEDSEQKDLHEELYKTDMQGSVSVGVTFLNPIEEDHDYLNFGVALNTHSVDLDEYDLSQMTVLYLGNENEITKGIEWTGLEGGGHHVEGMLRIERNQGETRLDYTDKGMIRLEIRDLDDVKSRVFEWPQD